MSEIVTLSDEYAGCAPDDRSAAVQASLAMSRAAMAEALAYALIAAADALPDAG